MAAVGVERHLAGAEHREPQASAAPDHGPALPRLLEDDELDATVPGAPGGGGVGVEGVGLAEAHRLEAILLDPPADEVAAHRVGAVLAQVQVVLGGADEDNLYLSQD